jgi:hypothetical protein
MDTKERQAVFTERSEARSGARTGPKTGVRHTALAAKNDLKKWKMISRGLLKKIFEFRSCRNFNPGYAASA